MLVRLAADLLPLLERRLETLSDVHTQGEQTRKNCLLSLRNVLRDELPASPLKSVRPALRPEPNNALLGPGKYGSVWRAWRWLELRQERFSEIWRCGLPLVHRALGLLVAAKVAEREDAFLIDDLATLRLAGADSGLVVSPRSQDTRVHGNRWRACEVSTFTRRARATFRVSRRDARSASAS